MGVVVQLCWTFLRYTIFNIWVMIFVIPAALLKLYLKMSIRKMDLNSRLDGKTVIITGGNIGIGFETAKELSHRGARIILACRNVGSAHLAKDAIIKETRNDDIAVKRVDLSTIWSIKQFAKEILEEEKRIDMLILNAATGIVRNTKTKDDLQLAWQVNQFSSVLLINLLLERMKESGPGRIIFVNSSLQHFGKVSSYDKNNYEKSNCPWKIHCNTRYANILTASYLADKLKDSGITVNTANPGFVNTPIWKRAKVELLRYVIATIEENFGKDLVDGAATTLMLALDPKLKTVTGKYFKNCRLSNCKSRDSKNLKLGEKVWQMSEEALGLKEDERYFKD